MNGSGGTLLAAVCHQYCILTLATNKSAGVSSSTSPFPAEVGSYHQISTCHRGNTPRRAQCPF